MRGTPGLLRLRLAMYGDTFFPGSWPPSPVTTHTLSPKALKPSVPATCKFQLMCQDIQATANLSKLPECWCASADNDNAPASAFIPITLKTSSEGEGERRPGDHTGTGTEDLQFQDIRGQAGC
ncbi:MAG: hypothetical protein FRX49_06797 [Trebouxia sp. A1-2]|nr:MAG: hypothetical protein FRX49_06797 [Trebouxia sp. A1-2]